MKQSDLWDILNEFPSAANTIYGSLKLQAVQHVKNNKGAMRTVETHPKAKEEVSWMTRSYCMGGGFSRSKLGEFLGRVS